MYSSLSIKELSPSHTESHDFVIVRLLAILAKTSRQSFVQPENCVVGCENFWMVAHIYKIYEIIGLTQVVPFYTTGRVVPVCGQNAQPLALYQIPKVACCTCAGNIFPATYFKGNHKFAILACITARVSRTCRDACQYR